MWIERPARDTEGQSGQLREDLEDGNSAENTGELEGSWNLPDGIGSQGDMPMEWVSDRRYWGPSFREKGAVESASRSVTPGLAEAEGTQEV